MAVQEGSAKNLQGGVIDTGCHLAYIASSKKVSTVPFWKVFSSDKFADGAGVGL
jgi:hypothetical protein